MTESAVNASQAEASDQDCLACRITGSLTFIGTGTYLLYESRKQMTAERQAVQHLRLLQKQSQVPLTVQQRLQMRRYGRRTGFAYVLGAGVICAGLYRAVM